jgi:hypothetical protein
MNVLCRGSPNGDRLAGSDHIGYLSVGVEVVIVETPAILNPVAFLNHPWPFQPLEYVFKIVTPGEEGSMFEWIADFVRIGR